MKIGENSFIAHCDGFREHDLVQIGKYSVINTFSEFRTHTFENWKLKFEYIQIGDYCQIGHSSTLMGGSIMENGSEVGNNTLVMKKETLQSGIYYVGLTALPIGPSTKIVPIPKKKKAANQSSSKKENDDYVIFMD